MKNFILVILLFLFTFNIKAQEKKISLNLGVGYTNPLGKLDDWCNGGTNRNISILYNITPKFSAGIEYNNSRIKTILNDSRDDFSILNAVLLKSRYYFTKSNLRPYASIMGGAYYNTILYPTGYDGDPMNISLYSTVISGAFELGLDIYNFAYISFTYHNLGTIKDVVILWENIDYINAKVSYYQITVGFDINMFSKKSK